jgi:phosphatidylinositol-3-phosphatase
MVDLLAQMRSSGRTRSAGVKSVKRITACLLLCAGMMFAAEGPTPTGVGHLDHVFLIVMENRGYSQILNHPSAPFINQLARSANLATNYYAVAHPSLTNYLEIVGGSNFGVLSDNSPDWHSTSCVPNIVAGTQNNESRGGNVCPIGGAGTDAATPAIDFTNETSGPPGEFNIDGVRAIGSLSNISGKTIGDQLVAAGRSWKSYQESLPMQGADRVNGSDGFYTTNTDFTQLPPLTSAGLVSLYAAKHNPFAYFRSVQEGIDPNNSLQNVVGFDGANGLYADLASGNVPNFSLIAPNQCNDQHGRTNAGPFCSSDPSLIYRGDVTVQTLVNSIKSSGAWREGKNAIVVVWDENDFSVGIPNRVMLIVDTNYGVHRVQSSHFYTHFSLLRSLEAGFNLPCLNHACDADVAPLADLFRATHATWPQPAPR